MGTYEASPRSRRSILATAAAGAATVAVASLAKPLSVKAATGDPVVAGTANTADMATTLTATPAEPANSVAALNAIGSGSGPGITGASPHGSGVLGLSGETNAGPYWRPDVGVSGSAQGLDAHAGVAGDSDLGFGVLGTAGGVGVLGAGGVAGVVANGFDLTATSLYAVSSGYPLPAPAPNTAAHVRRSVSAAGHALFVDGRMRLKWSGRVSVAAGVTSKKISVAGMTSSRMIFAMLQTNEPGTWIRAAVPSTGAVTFHFSRAMPSSTVVAWMAVG